MAITVADGYTDSDVATLEIKFDAEEEEEPVAEATLEGFFKDGNQVIEFTVVEDENYEANQVQAKLSGFINMPEGDANYRDFILVEADEEGFELSADYFKYNEDGWKSFENEDIKDNRAYWGPAAGTEIDLSDLEEADSVLAPIEDNFAINLPVGTYTLKVGIAKVVEGGYEDVFVTNGVKIIVREAYVLIAHGDTEVEASDNQVPYKLHWNGTEASLAGSILSWTETLDRADHDLGEFKFNDLPEGSYEINDDDTVTFPAVKLKFSKPGEYVYSATLKLADGSEYGVSITVTATGYELTGEGDTTVVASNDQIPYKLHWNGTEASLAGSELEWTETRDEVQIDSGEFKFDDLPEDSYEVNDDGTITFPAVKLKFSLPGEYVYSATLKLADGSEYGVSITVTATEDPGVAAVFESTGNVGIAPDTAGDAAGKIYAEYKLVANEEDISLAVDNIGDEGYIKVKVGDGEWTDLTANTDNTLWFNVEADTGERTFEVRTKDGKIYTATLDWDKEIEGAEWVSTGGEGIRPETGDTYVEYKLMDDDKQISLHEDNVKLIAQKVEDKWVKLTPNTDETLWFFKEADTGDRDFFVVMNDGTMYKATLKYEAPVAGTIVKTPYWGTPDNVFYYFDFELGNEFTIGDLSSLTAKAYDGDTLLSTISLKSEKFMEYKELTKLGGSFRSNPEVSSSSSWVLEAFDGTMPTKIVVEYVKGDKTYTFGLEDIVWIDEGYQNVSNISQNKGYATIQAAVNAANNGDTILIGPGEYDVTYLEEDAFKHYLWIDKPVIIKAAYADKKPVLKAKYEEGRGKGAHQQATVHITADNVTLDGLEIHAIEDYGDWSKVVEITDANNAAIQNCEIKSETNVHTSLYLAGQSIGKYTIMNNILDGGIVPANGAGNADGGGDSVISGNTINASISFTGKTNSGWDPNAIEVYPEIKDNTINGLSGLLINSRDEDINKLISDETMQNIITNNTFPEGIVGVVQDSYEYYDRTLYRKRLVLNPAVYNETSGKGYDTLEAAVADADDNAILILGQDVTLESWLQLNRPLTLDGNCKTITTTTDPNGPGIHLQASSINIKNITIDGSAKDLINIAKDCDNITIEGVIFEGDSETTRYGLYANSGFTNLKITDSKFKDLKKGIGLEAGAFTIISNTFAGISGNYLEVVGITEEIFNEILKDNGFDVEVELDGINIKKKEEQS